MIKENEITMEIIGSEIQDEIFAIRNFRNWPSLIGISDSGDMDLYLDSKDCGNKEFIVILHEIGKDGECDGN